MTRTTSSWVALLVLMLPAHAAGQADLFAAVRTRDLAKVQQVLGEGADANARDEKGQTPLHVAVEENAPEIAEAVLNAGAMPILTDWKGISPLALAESKKSAKIVDLLRRAIGPQAADASACELRRLRSDNAEGTQFRFLAGHPGRIREAVVDALQAMGFVPKDDSFQATCSG